MELFYRGYDAGAPVTSGARHWVAAGARVAVSMVRSVPRLPDALFETVKKNFTMQRLWGLSLVLAGWVIATIVGGPVAWGVNALLVVLGLTELWGEIGALGADLREWLLAAYRAETDAELDGAGAHFAVALGRGLWTGLEVVVTHRVFRAAEAQIHKRVPMPDALRVEYERAVRQREGAQSPKVGAETEWRGERRAASTESAIERAREVAREGVDGVSRGARYEGMKRAGDEVPVVAMAAPGTVVAVGAVALVAWAAGARKRTT